MSATITNRIDKLIGLFTITILFGKFLGDYVVIVLTRWVGTDMGYLIGIIVTTIMLIVWPRIEHE